MLALRATTQGVYLHKDIPAPSPPPGHALLDPISVLITDSDLAVVRRDNPFEGTLGSVFIARVAAVNEPSGRHEPLVGQRVTCPGPIIDTPSDLARRGLPDHEPARRVPGLIRCDGALATRLVLPIAALAPVPTAVPDDHALLAHPLALAAHSCRVADVASRRFVTILGDSLLALLTARVAARLNPLARLIAVDNTRAPVLERWGIRHRPAEDVGLRHDQDAVIDCTATPAMLDAALRMLRPRGTLVMLAPACPVPDLPHTQPPHTQPLPADAIDLTPAILHEITLVGLRTAPLASGYAALGPDLDPELALVISRRFPLDAAMEALRAAASPNNTAVIVDIAQR